MNFKTPIFENPISENQGQKRENTRSKNPAYENYTTENRTLINPNIKRSPKWKRYLMSVGIPIMSLLSYINPANATENTNTKHKPVPQMTIPTDSQCEELENAPIKDITNVEEVATHIQCDPTYRNKYVYNEKQKKIEEQKQIMEKYKGVFENQIYISYNVVQEILKQMEKQLQEIQIYYKQKKIWNFSTF